MDKYTVYAYRQGKKLLLKISLMLSMPSKPIGVLFKTKFKSILNKYYRYNWKSRLSETVCF